uniref:glycosyltransferase family 2 protein n=1 Tax=Nonlabens sp. TaxID=1888209 RepID=UPI0025DBDB7B
QTVLPNRLVIIEQNADLNAATALSYLVEEDWPFQITHELISQTGACNARNLALSKTTAPWVLLFDDDVRIPDHFISDVQEFLNKTAVKSVTFACLQKEETESMQAFKQWESFGSGCSIVHIELVERCKFDMALEHGYGEDVDYGMQIRQAGYDVIYAPQIQLLHLKAPVGGFRKPHVFPWQEDEVQPKPSPQIMYYRKKNYTHKQLLGYKMVQFFKTYGVFGTILPWKHYKKYQEAWNQSEKWASQL